MPLRRVDTGRQKSLTPLCSRTVSVAQAVLQRAALDHVAEVDHRNVGILAVISAFVQHLHRRAFHAVDGNLEPGQGK